MTKRILSFLLLILFSTTLLACTSDNGTSKSEEERFKDAMVELSCNVIKPFFEEENDFETASAIGDQAFAAILSKHGFELSEHWYRLTDKYMADAAIKEEVRQRVIEDCDFDMDLGEDLAP